MFAIFELPKTQKEVFGYIIGENNFNVILLTEIKSLILSKKNRMHKIFDATSIDYMKNYVGPVYQEMYRKVRNLIDSAEGQGIKIPKSNKVRFYHSITEQAIASCGNQWLENQRRIVPNETMLEALEEVEKIQEGISPKEGIKTGVDYVREFRQGNT